MKAISIIIDYHGHLPIIASLDRDHTGEHAVLILCETEGDDSGVIPPIPLSLHNIEPDSACAER